MLSLKEYSEGRKQPFNTGLDTLEGNCPVSPGGILPCRVCAGLQGALRTTQHRPAAQARAQRGRGRGLLSEAESPLFN